METYENKISVIIPVYNMPETTKRLLQKLSYQKAHYYPETEIIAIDDASTEDMSFMDHIEGVTVVHWKKNKGQSAARNAGMKMSTGQYIAFCDCDDDISDDYLHVMYQDIRKGYDYVVYNWHYKDENGWHQTNRVDRHTSYQTRWSNAVWAYVFDRKIFTDPWILFDEKLNVGEDTKWLDRVFKPGLYGKLNYTWRTDAAIYYYDATNPNSVTRLYNAGKIPERRKG